MVKVAVVTIDSKKLKLGKDYNLRRCNRHCDFPAKTATNKQSGDYCDRAMTQPSDEEIRYLLTKRALVVDVQQDVFGRPVVIANQCIEALPRKVGEQNPPGTLATVDPDGKINMNKEVK